tara:strand:- start:273 stop:1001 length:729 start_codon:yes stop_codon:yes gene_type:complete
LRCSTPELYTNNHHISSKNIDTYKRYLKERITNKPFQYIINKATFYGRDFFVDERVLIPRPESELFIDILKKYNSFNHALDIGTGSGCLAITISLEGIARLVDAIDNSSGAIDVASYNRKILSPTKVNLMHQSFFNFTAQRPYDLIVSNPPYIPSNQIITLDKDVLHEPINSLTDFSDGLLFYKYIAKNINSLLGSNGIILIEVGDSTQAEYIANMFSENGLSYTVHKDLQGCDRIIEAQYR